MWRWLTPDQGLDVVEVTDLVQSDDGFVWLANHTGVFRWDGSDVERVDGELIEDAVKQLVSTPTGELYARDIRGGLWRVDGERTERLEAPVEGGFPDISLGEDGALLATCGGGLWRRASEAWRAVEVPDEVGDVVIARRGRPGELLLRGANGWFRVAGDEAVRLLPPVMGPNEAQVDARGRIWMQHYNQVAVVEPDGTLVGQYGNDESFRDLTVRGGDVWMSSGRALYRFREDAVVDGVLVPERHANGEYGVSSSGPLMVDHEGSLWMGSFRGLGLLADPDAVRFDATDGTIQAAYRYATATEDRLWFGTWQGWAMLDRQTERIRFENRLPVKTKLCLDGAGLAWGLSSRADRSRAFVALGPLGEERAVWPIRAWSNFGDHCASHADGSVLFTANTGLYRLAAGGRDAPERVAELPFERGLPNAGYRFVLLSDRGRTLWIASGPQVCRAALAAVDAGTPDWSCEPLPRAANVRAMVETDAGNVWAASDGGGLFRHDGARFEPHPASADLPSRSVTGLGASPRGGVWVLSHATVVRVHDRPDLPEGWLVEESLAGWLAGLVNKPTDVVEDPDGTLWFTAASGLAKVPPSARVPPQNRPHVRVLEARIDGQPASGTLRLPSPDSRISLRFAAASYKAPRLLRYRMRLDDGAWSEPTRRATYELYGLPAGDHQVRVQATLDGAHWSEPPATVSIAVPLPWYGRLELWALALVAAGIIAALLYRLRFLMRLSAERLRTRIAMDLHDEVGAGLASIELLGGLLEGDLPEDSRRDVAGRVRETADELGGAMRAIVWSLKPESLRIGALGVFIDERARDLLGELDDGGGLHVTRPPADATAGLGLDVLRGVQLIALEALHNVSRHARASRVQIVLEAVGRGRWRLVIEDDGVGLGEGSAERSDRGNGLRGMRKRADAIGAELVLDQGPLGGTRVELVFSARAKGRTA